MMKESDKGKEKKREKRGTREKREKREKKEKREEIRDTREERIRDTRKERRLPFSLRGPPSRSDRNRPTKGGKRNEVERRTEWDLRVLY